MQWAEIGGVHLVTALVVLLNLLVYRLGRAHKGRRLAEAAMVTIILLTGGFLLRIQVRTELAGSTDPVKLAVLQPNSSYDNFTGYEPRLTELLDQSKDLVRSGARAVIWPEYSLPLYPRQRPEYGERFQAFAREHAPLIGGFTDRRSHGEIYNAVFLFDGQEMQQYNKVHLAPFGEYIPFRPLFFFIRRITDEISDFTSGEGPVSLTLLGHPVGLPICYEAIFPGLVRRFVDAGSKLLIVTSNDSWYSGGKAHPQLLAMSAMRAVENRRYLLRSTANGISAWVTPLGEIRDRIPYGREGSFIAPVRFLASRTLFTRGGVHFGLVCLVLCGFLALWQIRRKFGR
jgi:apolipoprotein N-acyltransferase